ncbi:DUF4440 domain-containing protein [Massilia horti]|uniref:Nuclear transport factor 2 family protein n=1 Tax=Massilia horti TaxID=2562153 RepID=A0A4Y9TAV5_9BURK|nr:DUF4440 domain-containing protein [Massilia horti]TFW35895.1 hypothetical protein E4O92_00930 [Massilia horti]
MRILVLLIGALLAQGASAGSTPEQTVAALWPSLSHAAGEPGDAATLGRLFQPDGVVFGGTHRENKPVFTRTSAADFITAQGRPRPKPFYECEVAREVKTYDRFATVYSVVESRTDRNAAKPDFVGVNSIQLYKFDDEWKIIALYYHVESPGLRISLEGGKSGICLGAD